MVFASWTTTPRYAVRGGPPKGWPTYRICPSLKRIVLTMKPEAQWYLVEALGNARARLGIRDDYESKQLGLSHFAGVLAGFRYLDVVTQEEERSWYRKMLVALGYELPDPAPPGFARAIYTGDPEKRPLSPAPETTPQFVRSVPGPDQEFEVHEGRLRVIAAEIYDTGVVIRWRVAPEPAISSVFPAEAAAFDADVEGLEEWAAQDLRQKAERSFRMMRLYTFVLTDDVGTEYFPHGGGRGGGSNGMAGDAMFRPAPRSAASHLDFSWLTAKVQISLA